MSHKITVTLLDPEQQALEEYAALSGYSLNRTIRWALCLMLGLPVPQRVRDDAEKLDILRRAASS